MKFNIPCRSNPMPYYVNKTDYSKMPLTIKCIEDGSFSFNWYGSTASNTYYYRKNDGAWTNYNINSTINCVSGDVFAFSGTANTFSQNDSNRYNFKSSSGKYNVYGNILSLCNNDDTPRDYKFCGLFGWDSTSYRLDIVDASNLILPSSTQYSYTYKRIFRSCSSLTGAPIWREITPSYTKSHNEFFWDTKIKKLKINATSIVSDNYAYDSTVYCSSLSAVEVAITNWNKYFASNFFNYSSSTGIFIKPESLPIQRGNNYIKDNWTVLNRHSNGTLWQVNSSNVETGQYTGEDPFSPQN